MEEIKNNEFFRSLLVPVPLKSIEKEMNKRHGFDRRIIRKLIDDYIKKSSEQYETLAELMIELMNSEVSLQDPNKRKIDEFQNKLEGVDKRFGYVDQFMQELDPKQRSLILRDYIDETAESLRMHRSDLLTIVKQKDEWNTNDVLFVSYYDKYVNYLDMVAFTSVREKSLSQFVKGMLYVLAFLYQVVIYAYVKDKLLAEVMVRRYSELTLLTSNLSKKRDKMRKEIVSALKDLGPPESVITVVSNES